MTSQQSLERLVAGWMADQPPVASDGALIDRVVETTSRQRPRPRWLALLLEAPMRTHARVIVGSPTRRMALVVALLILGLLAAVGVGIVAAPARAAIGGLAGLPRRTRPRRHRWHGPRRESGRAVDRQPGGTGQEQSSR